MNIYRRMAWYGLMLITLLIMPMTMWGISRYYIITINGVNAMAQLITAWTLFVLIMWILIVRDLEKRVQGSVTKVNE